MEVKPWSRVAQRGGRCPIRGNVPAQVGQGSEQPDPAEDVPARCVLRKPFCDSTVLKKPMNSSEGKHCSWWASPVAPSLEPSPACCCHSLTKSFPAALSAFRSLQASDLQIFGHAGPECTGVGTR